MTAVDLLLVGIGGACGAVGRHAVGRALSGRRSLVAVNVAGSLLLGAVLAAPLSPSAMRFAGVGFCGAFTTFSSVAVEVATLTDEGRSGAAAALAGGTLIAALSAVLLGAAAVEAAW
ncbi:hypothetical protein GCM10027435_10330 [Haloparvum alkalitolerans]|uniref:fluoride efflux transporter FluC n=1 Tax=Haloparvum alkalitolerans TaxID=1042953 RepID=UPI003CE89AC4